MVDRPLGSSAKRPQRLPRHSGHTLQNRGGNILIHGTTPAGLAQESDLGLVEGSEPKGG